MIHQYWFFRLHKLSGGFIKAFRLSLRSQLHYDTGCTAFHKTAKRDCDRLCEERCGSIDLGQDFFREPQTFHLPRSSKTFETFPWHSLSFHFKASFYCLWIKQEVGLQPFFMEAPCSRYLFSTFAQGACGSFC